MKSLRGEGLWFCNPQSKIACLKTLCVCKSGMIHNIYIGGYILRIEISYQTEILSSCTLRLVVKPRLVRSRTTDT